MSLTKNQLAKLSDICADVGQVSLASVVIPFTLNQTRLWLVILGVALCILFWYISLRLLKEDEL